MIEGLSALAVAGNILQFVQTTVKVLINSAEVYKSGKDLLVAEQQLENISSNLQDLTAELLGLCTSTPSSSSVIENCVRDANEETLRLAQELGQFLNKLKASGSHSIWHGLKVAFKQRWCKPELEELLERLSQARSNLTLAYLAYIHQQLAAGSPGVTNTDFELQNILQDAVQQTATYMDASFQDLTSRLVQSERNEKLIVKELRSFSSHHQSDIAALSRRLNDISLARDARLDTFLQDLKSGLGHLVTNPTNPMLLDTNQRKDLRQKVFKALNYPRLEQSFSRIPKAHERTFSWACKEGKSEEQVVLHGKHNFVRWLRSHDSSDRIYWVCGKPGSGKSTLLRYLDESPATIATLKFWTNGRHLLRAGHYFWDLGNELQKSMEGFLRSLLRQLLQQISFLEDVQYDRMQSENESVGKNTSFLRSKYPDTTLDCFERDRLDAIALAPNPASGTTWDCNELKNCLHYIMHRCKEKYCFFLIIDGLDEFRADFEQQRDLLDYLTDITSWGNVKMCLSSRPWTIFQSTYKDSPQMRLEVLTYGDIQLYVQAKLEGDSMFQELRLYEEEEAEQLVSDIVERAQGVFLWVRLVIMEVLRGLTDGDTIQGLIERVEKLPDGLDDFFMRILNSVPTTYRKECSSLLQITLDCGEEIARSQMTVLELSYVEKGRPNFALEFGFRPLDWTKHGLIARQGQLMKRRLDSRTMGLLEVTNPMEQFSPGQNITFLHRTLKEFFLTDRAQRRLYEDTGGRYKSRLYMCNAYLANILALSGSMSQLDGFDSNLLLNSMSKLMRYITYLAPGQQDMFRRLLKPIAVEMTGSRLYNSGGFSALSLSIIGLARDIENVV